MLFTTETISKDELNSISNFFDQFEQEVKTVSPEEALVETPVSKYNTSLVAECYTKSVYDIAHTTTSHKVTRRRNLQQVMQESFFYGANRFGNNYIA